MEMLLEICAALMIITGALLYICIPTILIYDRLDKKYGIDSNHMFTVAACWIFISSTVVCLVFG